MSKKPEIRVSIIIPAYNEEKFISATLESLLAQTYKRYEIIVVDNNSKDDTNKIAKKYVKTVLLEKKKGYHNAVNRGAKAAKGEIITFCDADTIYPKDWLEKIVNGFDRKDDVVAVFGASAFRTESFFFKNFIEIWIVPITLLIKYILRLNLTCGFNFAMLKEDYFFVGGYDPGIYNSIGLDFELGQRLSKIGSIIYLPGVAVETSMRRLNENGNIKETITAIKTISCLVLRRKPSVSYDEYNIEYRGETRRLKWYIRVRARLVREKDNLLHLIKEGITSIKEKEQNKKRIHQIEHAIDKTNTQIELIQKKIRSIRKRFRKWRKDTKEMIKKRL